MDTLGKGIIHIWGGENWDGEKFHYVTQGNLKLMLLISGIFFLIVLDHG